MKLRGLALTLALTVAVPDALAQNPQGNAPGLAPGVAMSRPHLTAAQEQRYQAGVRAYASRQLREAIDIFTELARENPRDGVLGMIVASYASLPPSPEQADRLAAEADAHRDDVLLQFIAGVVSHYAAHHSGRTREEKVRLYEQTLRILPRCRPTLDFEPRLFIYLAISHFRLGHQAEAEALIEQAVPLGREDPDVYYCRAEIFQRTNIARSIADIDHYLEMDAINAARGATGDRGKLQRVRDMRAHLARVQAGEERLQEIWDPIAGTGGPHGQPGNNGPGPGAGSGGGGGGGGELLYRGRGGGRRGSSPWRYGLAILAVALLAALATAPADRRGDA